MKHKIKATPFLALVFAQILWGINTPIIKLGLRTVPLPLYLSATILGAAILIAPLAARNWNPLRSKDWTLLIAGSIIAITLGNVVLLMGLQKVPAVNASLIGLLGPLLLFIMSVEFLKERMSLKTFLGIMIALAGTAIILGKPWQVAGTNQTALTGNLFLLLAVLCDVVGTLVCKPVLKRAGAYQVTFIHLLAGILPVALFSIPYLTSVNSSTIGKNGFLAIVFNIVAITGANCLFMYGLKHKKAQDVGIFSYIHPLVTLIAAWFIPGETPQSKVYLGAVFIFIGIYFTEIKSSSQLRLYYHRRRA
jgi:drug/metabolite transporter (DMT)-like permease